MQSKPYAPHKRHYSAHLSFLFTELDFRNRFSAARASGFEYIEFPSPYDIPARQLAGWLAAEGQTYTQFALPSGKAERGEKGIAIFPDRLAEFREGVDLALDYADEVGVSMLHVMAGICGPACTIEPAVLWKTYIENLTYAAEAAAKRQKTVLVEAMSSLAVPHYLVDRQERAVAAIAACGQQNIKLLFDVFHAAAMDDDHQAFIGKHGHHIGHVHLADFPGRHEPGTGRLDFNAIQTALDEAGFKGVYGCEYVPVGATVDGLSWLAAC